MLLVARDEFLVKRMFLINIMTGNIVKHDGQADII